MSIRNTGILWMLFIIFFGGLYHTVNSQEINSNNVSTELRNRYSIKSLKTNSVGIPTHVEGDLTPAGSQGDEIDISYTFFEENKHLFKMENPRKELIRKKIKKDELGMTHVFFNQTYKGVMVYGGELIVHFTSQKRIKSVNGFYKHGINISPNPNISKQESEDIASLDLKNNFGTGDITDTRLMVYNHEGAYHLIWKMMLKIDSPPGNWEYFIDANSGEILYKANRIKFQGIS